MDNLQLESGEKQTQEKDAPTKDSEPELLQNFAEFDSPAILPAHIDESFSKNSEERPFGWGRFRPKCLQRLCTAKWFLFWLCLSGALQGLIINGFVSVVITTIEKRFGLRSTQTGLIASGYDIASFVSLIPVSYFGGRLGVSKPHYLSWGTALMGLGALVFSLPHFLVGPYYAVWTDINVCQVDNTTLLQSCVTDDNNYSVERLQWTVYIFLTAQFLMGVGAAPLFTIGVTYIDDNVSTKMSSIYLGIYYTMAIVGPALGYVIGGQILLIYTDFLVTDSSGLGMTNDNSAWIGAWWLGFIGAGIFCFILALPLFAYPIYLPGYEELRERKKLEGTVGNDDSPTKGFTSLKDLPKALVILTKNLTLLFLNLGAGFEALIIFGFSAFLPKILENQFSISPTWAALLMGLITVPAGGGGTYLGGYLVKRFKLTCAGVLKLNLIVIVVSTCCSFVFLFNCPNMDFAGITTDYKPSNEHALNNMAAYKQDLWSNVSPFDQRLGFDETCNSDCKCSTMNYEPICGTDNIIYYNPCYAGCQAESTEGSIKTYANCSCISTTPGMPDATNKTCTSSCRLLPYFVVACFTLMLFTFGSTMPLLSATLRCVEEDQRSLALGTQWFVMRILGSIPAPILFGSVIDGSCILWHEICEDNVGACLLYDNKDMSRNMWIIAFIGKCLSSSSFIAAWWFFKPPKSININNDRELELPEQLKSIE